MVLPQAATMADSQERDAESLGTFVHDFLGLERYAACALVEDGVLRSVVEQARHGDTLLEATGKDIAPLGFGIPAFGVKFNEMLQAKSVKDGEKVGIVDTLGAHLAQRVGIYNLLTEGASGQVGALGKIENGSKGGLVNSAPVDRP